LNPLNLVAPGLCGPLPSLDSLRVNTTLSSLARLLVRADKLQSAHKGFYPELAAMFNLQQASPVPSAVLSLLGQEQGVGDGFWFHADPVNLQADMDHAILRDSLSLDLKQDESDKLIKEVNEHFLDDGIRLIATDKDHWFLNIKDHACVETTALHDVIGCNVNFHMPKGDDEKFWKQFLNEVQMLFHMSDVNQQREKTGLMPINSLWLWGGGELPEIRNPFNQYVFANHSLVKGLSVFHEAKHYPLGNVESLFELIDDNPPALVVLDDIFIPACYGDVSSWQEALDVLFVQWIEPLISHAMSRKVAVRLYPCNGVSYLISPSNKYRFLRKGNIKDHISTYE
jgi:hypothetical protein